MLARMMVPMVLSGGLVLAGCATTASQPKYISSAEPTPQSPPAEPARPRPASSPAGLSARVQLAIGDIVDAPDMESAVDAYAAGLAADPASLPLHKAYLRK